MSRKIPAQAALAAAQVLVAFAVNAAGVFSLVAHADPFSEIDRIDAEMRAFRAREALERFSPVIGRRCADLGSLSPSDCAHSRSQAAAAGCIKPWEDNWLMENQYGIFCVGQRAEFVCPCGG